MEADGHRSVSVASACARLALQWELHCQAQEDEAHTLSCLTPSGAVGQKGEGSLAEGLNGCIPDPGRGGDYLGYLPKQEPAFDVFCFSSPICLSYCDICDRAVECCWSRDTGQFSSVQEAGKSYMAGASVSLCYRCVR